MKRILSAALVALSLVCACPAATYAVPAATTQKKAAVQTVTYSTNLRCKNCVKKVNENIAFEKGVKDLKVDLATQTITVTFDPARTSAEKLAAAIAKLGYKAEIKK